MKFMEMVKKVKAICDKDKDAPVKIFYPGLKGDFYVNSINGETEHFNVLYFIPNYGKGESEYSFSLEELLREDWTFVVR